MIQSVGPGERAVAPDGTRIGFDVREPDGSGPGEPLVLLAGQANSRAWWDTVRSSFGGYRTVVLDHAGTGTSDDAGDDGWSTRRFAGDVVAVLDAAGIGRAHVYGTSMGGRLAQWLAADHPGRVGALVLGCTTGGGAGAVPADPAVLERLADPATGARELRRLMAGPDWTGPLPVLGDLRMSRRARAGHRRASAQHDAWDVLPGVTAPTLVLHGAGDEFTPQENGRRLAGRIPGAAFVAFDGARHAFFLEERATAEVQRFLAAHPLPPG
ncbi:MULTISPECIES: alpha/beta fold hydrolase [unclassified Pseudonocardia]|uniref:alpha/beta fold hydrolase n=1 Tax=unclassified Pseudonocardia TaxID=2619320 RepID=UPI00094B6438|nr:MULTISPECIES: alpha/beta fold hydrolase [unclassified Pseudonocardia]OLL77507.1 Beta-ketoadipate enol-lactone hydrolase [Pseudonocardia sp. Ae150A_Ps1]OLL88379.1 Beta-ketoadipate enol-lactone hydrolase [Pseudonocardia sp. Ae263_Ps1]OLL91598.1 Beta-ketoadipate enol-lactone hydrolase [Pseudonocardia sp. Ae356_Ps1]